MAGEVKSAQITISEHWADHVHHKTVGKAPRWDAELGVVCACGKALGWPDPEHKETLSAYTKRVASERVDAASAPGRVKGAFGTYGGEREYDPELPVPGEFDPPDTSPVGHYPGSADNAPEPDDYPEPEQEPPVDWGTPDAEPDATESSVWDTVEPPEDEPEPEILDDAHVQTVARAVDEIVSLTTPDDEAQADAWAGSGETIGEQPPPWGDDGAADLLPSQEEQREQAEHAVGDTVTVAGTTFTKVGESPFPADVAKAVDEIRSPSPPEVPSNEGVGRDLVPYSGVPIMPGEGQELDPLSGRLAPLDPTLPYTPQDVELKIVEILRQLENSELFLRQQLARLHQATHNHDFRYNLALAQSDQRAADQRKAEAWLATEKERHEMTEAEMLVRALRDSQHNLRSQLSGFQSVARSLAVSMVNALDGRGPATQAVADRLPPEPSPWDR